MMEFHVESVIWILNNLSIHLQTKGVGMKQIFGLDVYRDNYEWLKNSEE